MRVFTDRRPMCKLIKWKIFEVLFSPFELILEMRRGKIGPNRDHTSHTFKISKSLK